MSVGYHVPRQIISDSGPPFPYVYSNGNAEIDVLFTKQHTQQWPYR